jgi:phosphohistidine swiveling domain-containing protein
MTTPSILTPQNLDESFFPLLGGKALSLYKLGRHGGAPVPPWFAISSQEFREAVRAAGIAAELEAALAELARAGVAREAVRKCRDTVEPLLERLEVSPVLRAAIAAAYAELGDGFVAVRSSATDEDGAEKSFAGCLETSLFVRGADEVAAAVRRCWLSGFSERSLAYRAARGGLDTPIEVAVVVQSMIDGDISGVFFTVDPTTAARQGILTATWGLGEGVVSGHLSCDTFYVDRDRSHVVEREIADKATAIVYDRERGAGTREVEVEAARRDAAVLSDDQIAQVSQVMWGIEQAYGHPVDVEWTWQAGKLWVLQARPITTVATAAPAAKPVDELAIRGERKRLWDNSNIVESYSGVTTPLTYSFARHAYSIVFSQAMQVLGVSRETVEDNSEIFQQMIGLLRGRVYYSLESWYRMFMLLPGYQFNAEFMEQMLGLSEQASYQKEKAAPASAAQKYLVELPRLLGMFAQLSRRVMRSEELVDDFFANFESAHKELWARDIEAMDFSTLADFYVEAERRLMHRWQAPIVNDILTMISYGLMRKAIGAWIGADGALQNDLLCGEGGLLSTAPTANLLRVMVEVRKHPELCELLRTSPREVIAERVAADARWQWLADEIEAHVEEYGDRCIDELKLETPTLREDPTFVYAALKAYLAAPPVTVDEMVHKERAIRARAEERVQKALSGQPARYHSFMWTVRRARMHVKNRENMRLARTRAFAVMRRVAVTMGKRLFEGGWLDDPRDVFYLQVDELIAFARGTSVTTDLRGLAALRKREFEGYRKAADLPDRLWTTGATYMDPQIRGSGGRVSSSERAVQGEVLKGIAASPGVVRAPARLVRDPLNVELNGEVLIAHRTDPGWVPLFPSAVAVVVERGSVLSHSAIVAREFGIPCVVGLRDALTQLEDGAMIEVNGDAGTVTVL